MEAESTAAPNSQESQPLLFPEMDQFFPGNDAAAVDTSLSKASKGIPLSVTNSTSLEREILGSESHIDEIPHLRFAA